jgi:hypothetical protein
MKLLLCGHLQNEAGGFESLQKLYSRSYLDLEPEAEILTESSTSKKFWILQDPAKKLKVLPDPDEP